MNCDFVWKMIRQGIKIFEIKFQNGSPFAFCYIMMSDAIMSNEAQMGCSKTLLIFILTSLGFIKI